MTIRSNPITGAVIIGVDESPAGAAALAWGLARASRDGSPVRLVRVDEGGQRRASSLRKHLLLRTAQQAARTHPRLAIDALLGAGDPADVLTRIAEPGDLVVLGASTRPDRSSLPHRLLPVLHTALAVVPPRSLRFSSGVVVSVQSRAIAGGLAAAAACEVGDGEQVLLVHALDGVDLAPAPAVTRRALPGAVDLRSVCLRGRQVETLLGFARDTRLLLLAADETNTELLGEVLNAVDAPVLILPGYMVPAAHPVPVTAGRAQLRLAG